MTATRKAVNQYLGGSGLPPERCRSLDIMAKVDPVGAMEAARAAVAERDRAGRAPRRRRDPDELITAAIGEGRFAESRRQYYRDLFATAPATAERLLTETPENGGLVAVAITASGPPELTAAQEDAAHAAYMRNSHRNAAQALGYGGSSRWSVEARQGRVNHISDRG